METLSMELISNATEKCSTVSSLIQSLSSVLRRNLQSLNQITSDLIDESFLKEIEAAIAKGTSVYFGQSLRDLKCVVTTTEESRDHEVFIQYKGPRKLVVVSMSLPHSSLLDVELTTLEELLNSVRSKLEEYSGYFRELEQIDRCCTVMEPVSPSFKEDYRRILLDERTWLHIEVTAEGLASNIHLVGQSANWQDKLQRGLLNWDHDRDILGNVMTMFDLTDFPTARNPLTSLQINHRQEEPPETVCSICLCSELPDHQGVPLPICQNATCGVFYHRSCLYQWLVACSGGRAPPLGVATGSCPSCLHSIACREHDC